MPPSPETRMCDAVTRTPVTEIESLAIMSDASVVIRLLAERSRERFEELQEDDGRLAKS